MRSFVACGLFGSLVGCDGLFGQDPPQVPEPVAPPAAAPAAGLVAPPGAIALLTWLDVAAGCEASFTILGGASTPIGVIPGSCPQEAWRDTSAIRTGDGKLLLKTPTGALERSKDGGVTVLPALPTSWFLDDVAYDASGAIVAGGRWRATEAEVAPEGDASRYRWTVDGEEVLYTSQNGDADAAVCGRFPWADGAWGKPALAPMGLTEGTNTPYCFVGGEGEALPRPSDGGPGVSLDAGPVEGAPPGDWHVEGAFAMKASEWLEGQNRLGPLYFAKGVPWSPVVGLDGAGVLAVEDHGTWLLACRAGHAAVVDVADGAVKWSGAICPTAWPPG